MRVMKDRLVFAECRVPESDAHELCPGLNATSECICWHHILQRRSVEHSVELWERIERELAQIAR